MEKASDNISPDKAMPQDPAPEAPAPEASTPETPVPVTPAPEEAPVQAAAAAQTDDLDDQIVQLQRQLEELRRQKQIELQQKLETERKKKQIEALQAAIRAEQNGEAAPAAPAGEADAGPREAFAFADGGDDDKNPFVQAAREADGSAGAADGEAKTGEEAPFYTGKPAFESAAGGKKGKPEKKKKEKKPAPADDGPREHNGTFRGLAAGAPVILLVMLALVCWAPLFMGDLVCPGEVGYLKVLAGVSGPSLLPHSADLAVMPMLGLLGWGVSLIPLPCPVQAFPLISFAGAAVCLLGVCVLCGFARLGRDVMFGSGLLLLCLPLFLSMANFIGPVPLACGLSLMAMGFLCRGWMRSFDLVGMVLGGLLAALAVLAGGLYYGLVPVLAGLIFAVWRGNMQRLRNTDAVAGVVVFVAALLLWFGALILFGDAGGKDLIKAALFSAPDTGTFLRRLLLAGVFFCPFLVIVITVSWPRIIAHSVGDLRASRSENASAYLWVALALAIAGAFISAQTFDIFLALCLLAVLTARALLNLGRFGTRCFFILVGLILLAVTLAMVAFFVPAVRSLAAPVLSGAVSVPPCLASLADKVIPFADSFWQDQMYLCLGLCLAPLVIAAVICHVAWRARTAAAPLLVSTVCVLLLAQPVGLLLPPVFVQVPEVMKLEAAAAILSGALTEEPAAPAEKPAAPAEAPAAAAAEAAPAEAPAAEAAPAEAPAAPAEEAAPAEAPAAPAEEAAPAEAPAAPAAEAAPAEAPAAPAEEAAPAEAPAAEAAPAEAPAEAAAAEAPSAAETAPAADDKAEATVSAVEDAVKAAAEEAKAAVEPVKAE